MEIKKDRLSVIGKLIGIYREELRDNSQNEYTMKAFCKDICSVNTLKSVELGSFSRSNEVYEDLLKKFDLKLGYFPVIDETINGIMGELYEAIEFSQNDIINDLTKKAIRLLETVKEYVYYSELLKLMEDVRKNYIHFAMIQAERYRRCESIYDVIDPIFSNILIIIMFNWIRREQMSDVTICKKFVEKYKLSDNKMITIRTILLYYNAISCHYIQMKKLIDEFEIELLQMNNRAKLIDVYNYGIIMRSYIDSDNIFEYKLHLTFVLLRNCKKSDKY